MAEIAPGTDALIGRNEIADLLGVTPRHISTLRRDGLPSVRVGSAHKYSGPAVVQWYITYKQEPEKKGTIDLRAATAKAEMAEYDLAKVRAETVSTDYMAAQLAALGSKVRAKLQTLPDKYAAELTDMATEDIRELLGTAVREVLQMLQAIPDELDAEEAAADSEDSILDSADDEDGE